MSHYVKKFEVRQKMQSRKNVIFLSDFSGERSTLQKNAVADQDDHFEMRKARLSAGIFLPPPPPIISPSSHPHFEEEGDYPFPRGSASENVSSFDNKISLKISIK